MKEVIYDRHHIVPSSRGGSCDDKNMLPIKRNKHIALHIMFENQLPHEQIATLLSMYGTAISRRFSKEICDAINDNDGYYYKDGVYRRI